MAATKAKNIVWDPTEATADDDALFDAWDEAAEEAAIAEAAKLADVPYIIIEGRIFAGRFPDGEILKCPLDFSVADLEAITADHDNPVDQVKALLNRLGNEKTAGALETKDLASVVIYAEKFFNVFNRIAGVALGKSLA
ncbi:hypothetical protein U6G28_02635 [Actinomycetaceae bacterium MB13-C1-2]|nr:hypothetical protein U6G28_02635 [Actinomycetaceae bacterium MB13-C1-2]